MHRIYQQTQRRVEFNFLPRNSASVVFVGCAKGALRQILSLNENWYQNVFVCACWVDIYFDEIWLVNVAEEGGCDEQCVMRYTFTPFSSCSN